MVISIFKFLWEYYGITLDAGSELTHKTAKRAFRFLKGCSFKAALKNPDLVKGGKIVYVSDAHGVIFPYVAPEKAKTAVTECTFTESKSEEKVSDDKSILDEIADMPTYIVGELLSKYKDKPSFYKVIKKELICRGTYENKKYKLRKEIIEIELEEGEYNDKYQRRREIKCKKS